MNLRIQGAPSVWVMAVPDDKGVKGISYVKRNSKTYILSCNL